MSPQNKAMYLSLCLHVVFGFCALACSRQMALQEERPLIMSFSIVQATPASAPGPPAAAATQPEAIQAEEKKPPSIPIKRLAQKVKKTTPPPPKKTIAREEAPQVAAKEELRPENSAPTATDGGTADTAAATTGKETSSPSLPSGGGLYSSSQLDAPLIVLAQSRPPYPKRARRQNTEGWIRVKFIVDEHGRVDEVTVLDAEPKGVFEQSVLQTIGEWRFKPGTMGGRIVKALVEQTITFKLEG